MLAMLSFILECGISTVGNCTRPALRIRVNISEIVSVINLPACFGHTGNQPVQCGFAESQARAAELAHIAVTTSAHRATVYHARRAGVARQLRQPSVIALGLQFGAQSLVFLNSLLLLLIALQP